MMDDEEKDLIVVQFIPVRKKKYLREYVQHEFDVHYEGRDIVRVFWTDEDVGKVCAFTSCNRSEALQFWRVAVNACRKVEGDPMIVQGSLGWKWRW